MGIWSRLGNVIKSYVNDGIETVSGKEHGRHNRRTGDSDYDAAYEELEDFLKGETLNTENDNSNGSGYAGASHDSGHQQRAVPRELAADFAELGLPASATKEQCKDAYKRLLKIHHPDRHSGHAENMKKATEKTSRINAAYDRLVKWFELS